jgi:cell wall assembly regulator SMI1
LEANLYDRIRSDPESTFKRGATSQQIASVEKQLGVTLPHSYRTFLLHFDGGEFRFGRMYRISSNGAGDFELREEIERASDFFAPFKDRTLLPFGDDYSGNYHCLDIVDQPDEPSVVLVGRLLQEDRSPEKLAKSLNEFIERSLEDA